MKKTPKIPLAEGKKRVAQAARLGEQRLCRPFFRREFNKKSFDELREDLRQAMRSSVEGGLSPDERAKITFQEWHFSHAIDAVLAVLATNGIDVRRIADGELKTLAREPSEYVLENMALAGAHWEYHKPAKRGPSLASLRRAWPHMWDAAK